MNYLGSINFLKFFILQQKYFEIERVRVWDYNVRDFKVKTKEKNGFSFWMGLSLKGEMEVWKNG